MSMDEKLIKFMTMLFALSVGLCRVTRAVSGIMQAAATIIGLYLLFKRRNVLCISPLLRNYYRAYIFFLASMVPSLFVSMEPKESLRFLVEYPVYQFLMFVFITMLETDRRRLRMALAVPMVSGAIDACVMVYQWLVLENFRPNGFGENPLHAAGSIFIMIIVTVTVGVDAGSFGEKLSRLARACLLPYFGAYLSCHHRSMWIMTPLPVAAAAFQFLISSRRCLLAALCTLVITGGFVASNPVYLNRLESVIQAENYSTRVRLNIWDSALKIYKDYPVAGVGLWQFGKYYVDFEYRGEEEKNRDSKFEGAHNGFLEVAVMTGTCGLIGYIGFCLGFMLLPLREWMKTRATFDALLFAVPFGYLCLLALVEDTFLGYKTGVRFFWLVMAIVFQMKQISERDTLIEALDTGKDKK